MHLTEIRINLCPGGGASRLKAFCSLTFDNTFVVRDVKLIEGHDGLFVAMPSRKLADHCPRCTEKNHLRAKFCNQCGQRLDPERSARQRSGNGMGAAMRPKLHADIAHPISVGSRREIESQVVHAYRNEVQRSKEPGYVAPSLDAEDFELYDPLPVREREPMLQLRQTGTA
jgi:stage V sporulation protein G